MELLNTEQVHIVFLIMNWQTEYIAFVIHCLFSYTRECISVGDMHFYALIKN